MSFLAEVQKTLHDVEGTLSTDATDAARWAAATAGDLWNTIDRIAKTVEKDSMAEIDAAKKHVEDAIAALIKHLHL